MPKLHKNLSEFNQRFVDSILSFFPEGIDAFQGENETLYFRGPIPNSPDKHIGSHVLVELEQDVRDLLASSDAGLKEEVAQHLINNLGTQIRCQYDSESIGRYALTDTGNMKIING